MNGPPRGRDPPADGPRTTQIKRKPIAATTPAITPGYVPSKEVAVETSRQDTFDTLPPHYAPARRSTLFSQIRTKWTRLRKRTRILILAGILALLALIIGLAAGLSSRSRVSNLPLPSSHGGPYTGDLTYYDPGLGACGITNTPADAIVSVSHIIFDAVSVGSDPNSNPLCGKKIRARRGGKSVDLTVRDRCTGCVSTDIDVTMSVFSDLANIDEGRVTVEWSWLEDVPL